MSRSYLALIGESPTWLTHYNIKLNKLISISPDVQIYRGIFLIFSRRNGETLPKYRLILPKYHLILPKNFFFLPKNWTISSGAIWEVPQKESEFSER